MVGDGVAELGDVGQVIDGVEASDEDRGNGEDKAIYQSLTEKSGDDFGTPFDHEAVDFALAKFVKQAGQADTAVFISIYANDLSTILFKLLLPFLARFVCSEDPGILELAG